MRHKASKGIPAAAPSNGGESMGMTILPGRPLPSWAQEQDVDEPAAQVVDEVTETVSDDLIAAEPGQAASLPNDGAAEPPTPQDSMMTAPATAGAGGLDAPAGQVGGPAPAGAYGSPYATPPGGFAAPVGAAAAGVANRGQVGSTAGYPTSPSAHSPGVGAFSPGAGAYPPGVGAYPPGVGAYSPGVGAYPPAPSAPSASYLAAPASESVPLAPTSYTATGPYTGPQQAGPAEHTLAGVATVSAVGRAAPNSYRSSAIPAPPTTSNLGVGSMARPIADPLPGRAPLAPGSPTPGAPAASAPAYGSPAPMTGAAGAGGTAGAAAASASGAGAAVQSPPTQTGAATQPTNAGVTDPYASAEQAPPQLSPEQVAMLLKLADMIAKGKIPGMPAPSDTMPSPEAGAAMKPSPWRFGSKKTPNAGDSTTVTEATTSTDATTSAGVIMAMGTVTGTGNETGAGTTVAGSRSDIGVDAMTGSGAGTATITNSPSTAQAAVVSATASSVVTPDPPTAAQPDNGNGNGRNLPLTAAPPRPQPARAQRTGSTRRTVLIGVGVAAVALAGLGAAYAFMASDTPPPVPATELTMPATVGDLVLVSSATLSEELKPLIGFGLRPAGVTITGAYGPDAMGPVSLATMATTIAAPTDAAGQITTWAERTGATVEEPLAGTGTAAGISCAAVAEHPDAPTGSFCVWNGTGERGHSYVVDAEPSAALETTAEFRSALDVSQAS